MSLNYGQIDMEEVKVLCPSCNKLQKTFVGTLGIRHCSECKASVDFQYNEADAEAMRLVCGCPICVRMTEELKNLKEML